MNTHQMNLTKNPFDKIKSGIKIIESRLFDEKRQKINIGDNIEFSCNENLNEKILTKVNAIYRYQNFLEMFNDFPPAFFGGNSIEELIKEIETFYSKDAQQKNGVVGIKVNLIK